MSNFVKEQIYHKAATNVTSIELSLTNHAKYPSFQHFS